MRVLFIVIAIASSLPSVGQLVFGQDRNRNDNSLSVNYSSPREFEIAGIEIKGVQFLDNTALISLSGLKVGDKIKIPGQAISSAIKKLWKQGIIGNISIYASKIEGSQIWLVIEMNERPRLTRYEFEGVTRGQKTELESDVELVRGRILTDVLIKNTELSVTRFFESKGFLNAKVNIVQQSDTLIGNGAKIKIMVDRGKKVKIRNINFIGNENFTDAKLRKKLKKTAELPRVKLPSKVLATSIQLLNPKNLVHFVTHKDTATVAEFKDRLADQVKIAVFKSPKYIEQDYEADKEAIISFYNSKGYRDAEITLDTVYGINEKHLNVDIHLDEGKKYYFREVDWAGNFVHDDNLLNAVLGIKKGDVYDLELINKKLNFNPTGPDISSLYMDNGYLFFSVNPVEVRVEQDSIDVEMRIYEGAQATINEVTLSGNDRTNDHVILREIRTLPGQKFSRAELIRTQRELSQLGYFDPEQVNPVPLPNPIDETVDIEWKLVEQPSDQIELSGGWGGTFGFVGTLGVSFNNFSLKDAVRFKRFPPMGDGQRLSVRMQANGRRFQSYSVGFSEPWLGGRKPNTFGINLSHSVQRSITTRNETIGSFKVTGVTLSLGRRLQWPDDFFTMSNSIALQRYSLFNFGQSLGFSTGDANSITFNNTISRNSVDNPMYPRQGSSLVLSTTFTPPYSLWRDIDYETADNEERYKWLEYHKWNFDAKYYLKVAGDLVIASRAHFGFIGSYTKKAGVGPFERFQLGGDGLTGQNFLLGTDVIGLRGYPNNSIVPRDIDNGIDGGTFFTKFVTELRYPVSLNPSATIYVLSFMEGGNNWNDFAQYNPYNLFRSAGVGVRIFMPAFGLLGLDWGYGFDALPGALEPSGAQFHFSIGQQIR
ncbi:MAG: BamA/TamA family outer membrane protein [Cyclobacteriaceae bacterium]|nr:BamA/TamA family outer membrane protein [Cyclobacteriaceae bacterium HetDA_MAG_MS6]